MFSGFFSKSLKLCCSFKTSGKCSLRIAILPATQTDCWTSVTGNHYLLTMAHAYRHSSASSIIAMSCYILYIYMYIWNGNMIIMWSCGHIWSPKTLLKQVMDLSGRPIFQPVIVQDVGQFCQAIQEIRLLGHFHLHILELPGYPNWACLHGLMTWYDLMD